MIGERHFLADKKGGGNSVMVGRGMSLSTAAVVCSNGVRWRGVRVFCLKDFREILFANRRWSLTRKRVYMGFIRSLS